MQKRRNYIIGFLLLATIHWATILLTAILTNVVGIFIEYEYVPWFGVFMIVVELSVAYKVLYKDRFFNVNNKDLLKLALTAILLFLTSQFNYLLEYQPGWCGNAFLDGTMDGVFETRNENEFYSQLVERVILSVAIIYFVMKKIKN